MKDEEIRHAAEEVVRELVRECDIFPEEVDETAAWLRVFAAKVRREALEDAARMACTGCLNGWKLEPVGTEGELRHIAYGCRHACHAEAIHALKARIEAP